MRRCLKRKARSTSSRRSPRIDGARFYDLPVNEEAVTLERAEVEVPSEIGGVVPFHAGETLRWRFAARLRPAPLVPITAAEMLLQPLVTFAGAALKAGAVGDPDDPTASGDQAFLLQPTG